MAFPCRGFWSKISELVWNIVDLATTFYVFVEMLSEFWQTTFPMPFSTWKRLDGRQEKGCEFNRGHCEVRLENDSSVSLSQCLCCGR